MLDDEWLSETFGQAEGQLSRAIRDCISLGNHLHLEVIDLAAPL